MNNLGAYIQHRWLNPRLPRQTAWDVRPVAAPIWGLGAIFGSGPVPGQLYTPSFATDFTGSGNMAVTPQRELFGRGVGRGAAPGYNYPTGSRVGISRRQPLGSIFGSAFDQASELMDFVKIGVWIIGGGIAGYMAGWLFRELRTANRRKPRRRNAGATRVTDAQIRALLNEARSAGDMKMVNVCKRALGGSGPARRECARVIAAARAMTPRSNTGSKRTFAIGDRVGYARQFLKNIGIGPTGEEWRWKGTIVKLGDGLPADRYSVVRFDHGYEVLVNNMNLAKIGSRPYVD